MSDRNRDEDQAPHPRATRTAIFGGTFDPVHLGHLFAAGEVLDGFDYERVVFVPAHISPHKSQAPEVSSSSRLEMLEIAIEGQSQFEVESLEINRTGPSFTIDTVRCFIDSGTVAGRLGLVVGADLVDGFETWREADEIEQLTDIIVVRRPGFSSPGFRRRHRTVDNFELGVSSREVRNRVRAGRTYRYLIPAKVAEYIELHRLYR